MVSNNLLLTEREGRTGNIRELKIRRRRASTTVDLVEGGWGEVAVAMAGKHP